MHQRYAVLVMGLVLLGSATAAPQAEEKPPPPSPKDYAAPGGVGPSRGWFVWHRWDADTWEAEISRDPPGETWKVRVLPWCTTYRFLVYGARPDELRPGERVNLFLAPDEKRKHAYVCHFQDELSQMQGHNHRWQVASVADGDRQFKAALYQGNEKKLEKDELSFELDEKCRILHEGKVVEKFPYKAGDRLLLNWVYRKDRRVVLLVSDDAGVKVLQEEEKARVAKEVAAEGMAAHVEEVDGGRVQLTVFATYWAQARDFKAGQAVNLRGTDKGLRPAGEAVTAKVVSVKPTGPYSSGPPDVKLELKQAGDARQAQAWQRDRAVVRLTAE
jgi:hypothetical protein